MAAVLVIQFLFFLCYMTKSSDESATDNPDSKRTLLSRKILDKNKPSFVNRTAFRRPGVDGVRVIQHKRNDNTRVARNIESTEKNEDSSKCNMDKYLIQSQDVCAKVLENGDSPKGASIPPDDGPLLRTDNSCDLKGVELDCNQIRQSYLFGKEQTSRTENSFPLAFGIKIHGFADQVHRLLRYIYREHNVYCIHIDKKAPSSVFQSFKRVKRCFDNVIVVEDRVDVVYSSIRQIEAELRCIKAVKSSRIKWKYYINLTGQEFMLKTNLEIVKYLSTLNGTNDIESYKVPGDMTHRFKQKAVLVKDKVIISRQRKAPFKTNIELRKGSAYGMFSREFVNFVLNHPLVKEFLTWLEDTYAPEETIWATLNALPEAPGGTKKERTYGNGLYRARAVIWSWNRGIRCHGQFVHWICIYGVENLAWLLESDKMVANKFYDSYQPLALTCLEMTMYKRLLDE